MARDHFRIAITQQLAPILASAGFKRTQPKHFMNVSGDLIRHVGFEMSQWGDRGFYLHLYVNTLLDPLGNLYSCRVGRRLQADPQRKIPWEAATESTATEAVESVVKTLQDGELAWLMSVKTLRDYVTEFIAQPETTADDFGLALVLAREGHTDRAWWSAEKLLRAPPDPDDGEWEQERRTRARILQSAINDQTVSSLLASWRAEYIEANKLGDLAS